MVFERALHDVKKEVEGELAVFFVKKQQEAKRISSHCVTLVDAIRDLTIRGGKRTRAFLCWLGYEAAKIKDQTSKIKNTEEKSKIATPRFLIHAMMGVELFQSFALIHDDIIDEDTTRRGGPAVHEHFRLHARLPAGQSLTHSPSNPSLAKHFGTSMAILAGDLALVWADELMGEVKSEDIYQRMKQEVIFGQSLDVMEEHMKVGIPKKLIDEYKTAWYSVIRPLQIGASLGGADGKILESFVGYGLAVGEAYQLRDDMLDGAVGEVTFKKQAANLQKRAARAVEKITVSQSAATLLGNFARFALDRRA